MILLQSLNLELLLFSPSLIGAHNVTVVSLVCQDASAVNGTERRSGCNKCEKALAETNKEKKINLKKTTEIKMQ